MNKITQKFQTSKLVKRLFIGMLVLVFLILGSYGGMAWYINANKKELLVSLTAKLNENLNGNMSIGSMDPAFLQGFPLLSLNLKNVAITDSLYSEHKQQFLRAGNFDIAVNALALLRGAFEIKKIEINNAAINLFTDTNGYSNSSVFKKSKAKPDGTGGTFPELRKFSLENVLLNIDNRKNKKLFRFKVTALDGDINYTPNGWEASIQLDTHAKSMAFSTRKGSFIKDKKVDGDLDIVYDATKDAISIKRSALEIGGEDFTVAADFRIEKSSAFSIRIENESILWKNASALLSPNISSRLDMFTITKPIIVTCDIVGDFDAQGDPLIHVKAKIRDNDLVTPGGTINKCNFDGEFTNNYHKESGYNDANSAIIFNDFTGEYAAMPFVMKKAYILNLEKPIAHGDFSSEFEVSKLNNLVDKELLGFSKGSAKVKVKYSADIENYKLEKPFVEGTVEINGADVKYTPRNLAFKDISVLLNFTDKDLFISNIHLRSGKSVIDMDGNIKNFLNLYYTAPEKIVVNWKVRSPHLYLAEFMGFVRGRKNTVVQKKSKPGNFTDEVNTFFENINVDMSLNVQKIFYNRFSATNASAQLSLNDSEIRIRNARVQHAGGIIKLNGVLSQQKAGRFNVNATVSHVDISRFFDAFNSFGLESVNASNLKGNLSTTAQLSGNLTETGTIVKNSLAGIVSVELQKVALNQFTPIKSIGKFAFPRRDFDTISIHNLKGRFDIAGEKVQISPMQVNSSILNMDIEGVYSFGKGTKIFIAVPLRNPERDKDITDEAELAKRRTRGIMLRLVAEDGKDGKVKIGLGRNKEEE